MRSRIDILEGKRDRIRARLRQAESTEQYWPSTRARVVIWQLEKELEDIDDQLYGVNLFRELSCA